MHMFTLQQWLLMTLSLEFPSMGTRPGEFPPSSLRPHSPFPPPLLHSQRHHHGRHTMPSSVVLAPIELKCYGKCPGNTTFCNKRTGKDTVLVVNAHNKGRPDERCCLKLPERDRKDKKTGKYIYSCVATGHNTTWADGSVSEPDRNAFREWVEFGPTANENSLRSGAAKWTPGQLEKRAAAMKALEDHRRNVASMTRRDIARAKYSNKRDVSLMGRPPVPSTPSISKEKASNAARPKKKAKVINEQDVLDFNAWRGRIMDHLRTHVESMRCYELLDEIPPGCPVHRTSHHNIALSHSKASIVYDYCSFMQSRDTKGSITEGWASQTCVQVAGGTKSEATVYRCWEEWSVNNR